MQTSPQNPKSSSQSAITSPHHVAELSCGSRRSPQGGPKSGEGGGGDEGGQGLGWGGVGGRGRGPRRRPFFGAWAGSWHTDSQLSENRPPTAPSPETAKLPAGLSCAPGHCFAGISWFVHLQEERRTSLTLMSWGLRPFT